MYYPTTHQPIAHRRPTSRMTYATRAPRRHSDRSIYTRRRSSQHPLILLATCVTITLIACATIILTAHAEQLDYAAYESAPSTGVFEATDSPATAADDWRLILVNRDHPAPEGTPELTQLRDGQAVDARCYPDLQRMFDAARSAGLSPAINSSYRSTEEQQQLLEEYTAEAMQEGLSADAARSKVLRTLAEPGKSEHQTGLAIDVTSEQHTEVTDSAVHEWMREHGWEYGWILRYPAGKEHLTGIDNEPWHFRYVGSEAAREIHESGVCLEEYLDAV